MRKGRDGEKKKTEKKGKNGKKKKKKKIRMKIVATTSLPAVDRPNADRWNANSMGPILMIGISTHNIPGIGIIISTMNFCNVV